MIRYPDSLPPATATTGSPSVSQSGGKWIYVFNQSGSITF